MPKIAYIKKKFSESATKTIAIANDIIEEYERQGFELTLRQLYYQFVARGLVENTEKSYKNLGNIISDARMAGLVDWDAITDRTRFLRKNSHWDNPAGIIKSAADNYKIDMWDRQDWRPEVWIEKDALVGVVAGVCSRYDVPYFSCRGYTSQSEMWSAAMRIHANFKKGQTPIIFHFGDHDPSGKDMTRDIEDRLKTFMGGVQVDRLALNWDQIEEFDPPPNPAKVSDPRAGAYIAEFGDKSWELDALEPKLLSDLIEEHIKNLIDKSIWSKDERQHKKEKELLMTASRKWDTIVGHLNGGKE